jgi:hypothetical protein
MFHMFLEYDYMNLYSYDFPWKYERIWPWIHFIGIDIPTHKKWSTARNLYVIIYHIRSTKILCAFADMATRHGPCCMASDSRKKSWTLHIWNETRHTLHIQSNFQHVVDVVLRLNLCHVYFTIPWCQQIRQMGLKTRRLGPGCRCCSHCWNHRSTWGEDSKMGARAPNYQLNREHIWTYAEMMITVTIKNCGNYWKYSFLDKANVGN